MQPVDSPASITFITRQNTLTILRKLSVLCATYSLPLAKTLLFALAFPLFFPVRRILQKWAVPAAFFNPAIMRKKHQEALRLLKEDTSFTTTIISIPTADKRLLEAVELTRPEYNDWLVMFPGNAGSWADCIVKESYRRSNFFKKRLFRDRPDHLAIRHLLDLFKKNILIFNYGGVGASQAPLLFITPQGLTHDTEAIFTHVENKPRIRQLTILGFSLGGALSTVNLAGRPLKQHIRYVLANDRSFSNTIDYHPWKGLLLRLFGWKLDPAIQAKRLLDKPEIVGLIAVTHKRDGVILKHWRFFDRLPPSVQPFWTHIEIDDLKPENLRMCLNGERYTGASLTHCRIYHWHEIAQVQRAEEQAFQRL